MTATQKKKLCWNCEGRVSLQEENCPYCAVYLGPAPDDAGGKDSLAPPYRLVESDEEERQVPKSPYAVQEADKEESQVDEVTKGDLKQVVLPLVLLSAGTLFFLFGLILVLFSDQGIFTLSWSADYWYFYLIFAVPLLFAGWRTLQRFDEDSDAE